MTRQAFCTGEPVTVAANMVSFSTSRTSSEDRPRNSYSVCARWAISLSRGPITTPPMSPTVHIILSSSSTTIDSSSISLPSARKVSRSSGVGPRPDSGTSR